MWILLSPCLSCSFQGLSHTDVRKFGMLRAYILSFSFTASILCVPVWAISIDLPWISLISSVAMLSQLESQQTVFISYRVSLPSITSFSLFLSISLLKLPIWSCPSALWIHESDCSCSPASRSINCFVHRQCAAFPDILYSPSYLLKARQQGLKRIVGTFGSGLPALCLRLL